METQPRPAFSELNSYETDFVYNEIFRKRVYLKHGITIPNEGVVFDVGANIGLFARFVKESSPNARIYAFEPAPEAFAHLKRNVRHESGVKTYNLGLGGRNGEAVFCYYPGYSVISGFHADTDLDSALIKTGLTEGVGISAEEAEALVGARFNESHRFFCRTKTLSKVLREENLERIDLLKIDAEKSELEILRGLKPNDWPKIRQAVIEVHGRESLDKIRYLFTAYGFRVTTEEDDVLAKSGVYTLYACRD